MSPIQQHAQAASQRSCEVVNRYYIETFRQRKKKTVENLPISPNQQPADSGILTFHVNYTAAA
jgi:hypothetical protein